MSEEEAIKFCDKLFQLIDSIDEDFDDQEVFDSLCYLIAKVKKILSESDYEKFKSLSNCQYWDVIDEWGDTLIKIEKYYSQKPDYVESEKLKSLLF